MCLVYMPTGDSGLPKWQHGIRYLHEGSEHKYSAVRLQVFILGRVLLLMERKKGQRKLRLLGFVFDRPGSGSHEIWRHKQTGRKVTTPHHRKDMAEGTLRAILRQAEVDVEVFLNA